MKIKQKLYPCIIIMLICLSGCQRQPQKYLTGIISEKGGNINNLVESSGALFGNESVKFGDPHCYLIVDVKDEKYIIEIGHDRIGSSGPKTVYNMCITTKVGNKIKFPFEITNGVPGFSKDRIGILDPDDIEILSN